jgi:hypothetical protein
MLSLDSSILDTVVNQALADAAAHPRWITAIGRALVELDSNPYLEWTDGHLLIGSPLGRCVRRQWHLPVRSVHPRPAVLSPRSGSPSAPLPRGPGSRPARS